MRFTFRNLFKTLIFIVLAYFIYLLGLITIQYIPVNFDVAFLAVKQEEIAKIHYQIAFFGHVYSSFFVVTLGLLQFSETIRKRAPKFHRLVGWSYVLLILLVACPSGFVIAIYANGGVLGQASFILLSFLWFLFTLLAFLAAIKSEFKRHRQFMIRSYALTLSAVSLRLFKYIIVSLFELPPMDTYKIVAVLGWTVNLIIAELYIRKSISNC
jgi:uncharacterized membrane protein